MSAEQAWPVLLALVVVLLLALVGLMAYIMLNPSRRRGRQVPTWPVFPEVPAPPEPQVHEGLSREEARAIDPLNPPTWKIFEPKSDREQRCTCHDRPLNPGQRVMFWPIPIPQDAPPETRQAVDLYCESTIREAQR